MAQSMSQLKHELTRVHYNITQRHGHTYGVWAKRVRDYEWQLIRVFNSKREAAQWVIEMRAKQ